MVSRIRCVHSCAKLPPSVHLTRIYRPQVSADVSQAQNERADVINKAAMTDAQRDEYDAKSVLEVIFSKIVKFKMTEV